MLPYAGAVAAPRLSVLSIFVDAVASGRYEALSFTCFTIRKA